MPEKRLSLIIVLLAALILSMSTSSVISQGTNLLQDPGFESTSMKTVVYDEASGTRFSVNAAWEGWYTASPREQPWQNQVPNGTGRNNAGFGFVRTGNRSAEVSRGQATFTAALYQTVSVTEGSNLIGSAWYVMDLSEGANSRARVGIDPNGGNNPFDSDVVWSDWGGNQLASQGFRQLTVQATATGTSATIFLYATQSVPADQNGIFWDDASLAVGGSGGTNPQQPGATAQPAATPVPQTVPVVVPQGTQDDGSIVHTVQPGDTVNSIAVAYGVTATEIIELNNLANPRLISVGQRLLVKEGSGTSGSSDTEDTETEDTSSETDDETTDNGDTSGETTTDAGSGSGEAGEEEAQPTSTPEATPTPRPTNPPAPVAQAEVENSVDISANFASLCVMVYSDMNNDTIRQDSESSLGGGLITLTKDGQEVDSFTTTDAANMSCFEELEPGQYIVDASAPAGYTLLPSGRSRPNLPAGQVVNIMFAAVDSSTIDVPAPDTSVVDAAPQDNDLAVEDATEDEDDSILQYVGLAVFALAGLTLIGGLGVTLALRGR